MARPKPNLDLYVEPKGSMTMFTPLTDRCRQWFDEEVQCPAEVRLGGAAGVQKQYADPIIRGARAAGLLVGVASRRAA